MKRVGFFGMCLAVLVLSQGCGVGYNSVMFATRSNVGFDADTAPPVVEVSITRTEGMRSPTFEGGQTLPVMATFSSDSNAFSDFFWGVRQSFATGEAAYTMSSLYDQVTPTDPKYENGYEEKKVKLSQVPDPDPPLMYRIFGKRVKYVEPGKVKPVTFGTNTTFGVKIAWDGQTGQFPSAINIGFKRKEGALAPVGIKDSKADIPSLLATIDNNVSTSGTSANTKYLQYFATGAAANNLAKQRAVRVAMLERADPTQKLMTKAEAKQKALEEKALPPPSQTTIDLDKQIFSVVKGNPALRKKAKEEFIDVYYPEYKNLIFDEFVYRASDEDRQKLLKYLQTTNP